MSATRFHTHTKPRVKLELFLPDFNETLIFLDTFSKKPQLLNFMKIRPVGADLFCAEGWTNGRTVRDMTKLIFAFRNFANALKNMLYY